MSNPPGLDAAISPTGPPSDPFTPPPAGHRDGPAAVAAAAERGGYPLPSPDWLPLREYACSPYAIGSRFGNMPASLTRLALVAPGGADGVLLQEARPRHRGDRKVPRIPRGGGFLPGRWAPRGSQGGHEG
eukprot:1179687-Prorocentrum_minimum.AAC.7